MLGNRKTIPIRSRSLIWDELKYFRDRFDIPLSDKELEGIPYFRPAEDSPEMVYFKEKRAALGGSIPRRITDPTRLEIPELERFDAQIKGSGERSISTTMAFVRILATLIRDKQIGKRVVPIVPDEARTFGMEGMFRQLGIYSSVGQLYVPEDSAELSVLMSNLKTGRSWKKASMKRVLLLPGCLLPRPTAHILTRLFRSIFTTPCLASNVWGIWPGQRATCRHAASY